jgi:diaminohydroxyphosphoribosylaminopyrimidine deaminase/5-amino-6-(5-phosphoribosylamino)uracil reductase
MKLAASLDGRTALDHGESQWITGEPARADGHAWRRRAGAVLTGAGTVLEDNPRLDVRMVPCDRQPLRVVIDSRLQAPPTSRIYSAPGQALVYCTRAVEAPAAALRARGVEVLERAGAGDKVDLAAVLADLAVRGVNELHIEAGERLNGSFLRERLVDELLVYLAPRMIGPGRGMFAGRPLARLQEAEVLDFVGVDRIGSDLRIVARIAGRDGFLA